MTFERSKLLARRIGGFTLIELLVVVAVIVLLIAIMLPGLGRARVKARTTVCGSNLRQIGLATNLYLDASEGSFWRYYSTQPTGRLWWFGFELGGPAAAGTTNRPLDKSQSPLATYTANLANLLQCPDFPYDGAYFPKFDQHAASYGYNLKLGPVGGETPRRTTYADRADRVFVFADGIHFDFGATYNEGHYLQYTAGAATPSGYAHFRHSASGGHIAQMVFIDGHVDSQPFVGPAFRVVNGGEAGNLQAFDGSNSIYGF